MTRTYLPVECGPLHGGRQTFYSFGLSGHPLANERRAVPQDHSLLLRRGQEANGIDGLRASTRRGPTAVGVRLAVSSARTCSTCSARIATDETNRGSAFADFGDDPESHSQEAPRHVTRRAIDTPNVSRLGQRLTATDVPNSQNFADPSAIRRQAGDGQRLLYRCLSIP